MPGHIYSGWIPLLLHYAKLLLCPGIKRLQEYALTIQCGLSRGVRPIDVDDKQRGEFTNLSLKSGLARKLGEAMIPLRKPQLFFLGFAALMYRKKWGYFVPRQLAIVISSCHAIIMPWHKE